MEIVLDKIYENRTRQYMQEVLNCYDNGSYRSVIVLLNSVCLSDLFYKLQELRDIYSDTVATEIITKIEEKIIKDKTSAEWERTLVDEIFKKTHILDSAGYTLLVHLHDYRNLTAHPVLDAASDLYQPSKELVESCIIEAYNNIFTKPSIFVKNIVDYMSEDLASKRGYILLDKQGFADYVERKYLVHMTDAMILKVVRAFWKFSYVLIDDECRSNRKLNHSLIFLLVKKYLHLIVGDMQNNQPIYSLYDDKETVLYMIVLLANIPIIYSHLSSEVKTLIEARIEGDKFYKLVSWFTLGSKREHVESLIAQEFRYLPKENYKRKFLEKIFSETGETDTLLRYYIYVVHYADSFNGVMNIMDDYIIPNLAKMKKERLEDIITSVNENNQIYLNYNLSSYCGRIWKYAKEYFSSEYISSSYPHFKIPVEA